MRFMMMERADHEKQGNVTMKEVFRRQAISEKYLWQVVNPLKKEGLIRAVASPGGGYALTRTAITLLLHDILAVLEGDKALVACTDEPAACPRRNACASRDVWKEMDEKLAQMLNSFTLAGMVDKQRAMDRESVKECRK